MGRKSVSVLLRSQLEKALPVVLTIILMSSVALAQDTTYVKRVVSQWTTIIPATQKAQTATDVLMNAYYSDGEFGFDDKLETMDDSWYSGIDLYINRDLYVIIDAIEKDNEAQFKLNRRSCIIIVGAGEEYLVAIYSFP